MQLRLSFTWVELLALLDYFDSSRLENSLVYAILRKGEVSNSFPESLIEDNFGIGAIVVWTSLSPAPQSPYI